MNVGRADYLYDYIYIAYVPGHLPGYARTFARIFSCFNPKVRAFMRVYPHISAQNPGHLPGRTLVFARTFIRFCPKTRAFTGAYPDICPGICPLQSKRDDHCYSRKKSDSVEPLSGLFVIISGRGRKMLR